ncbi:MAG TPA: sigma-54 dependent transcriptional regulator [Pseudomonadota bacterium]|nr:sigma-54 dependent transcriptional regulator [Pseudomonadota bacterium]HNK44413.1 sigma-54 dependent transcriptional regulator [Pseudomonadota bacterium]HNN50211.1 sigma-54 dependent transcriptional regulator [Pseudomonadota bacterium]HNO68136.1 sigma-54 dependent transcriptional regulator [Pseudomonadota bacterium]
MQAPSLARHFHLLSDADLQALAPVLRHLREQRTRVLDEFYKRYLIHFGQEVSLGFSDFSALYGRDLDAMVRHLADLDMDDFAAEVRAVGYEMSERGVPFAEVISSLHLLEEAVGTVLGPAVARGELQPRVFQIFDKLSHCRIIVLAGAYFTGQSADAEQQLHNVSSLQDGSDLARQFSSLVGQSEAMRRLFAQLQAAALSPGGAALLVGESGTGKELAARALHQKSRGVKRPFVAVNCAALPRDLIESELFGHRRGAYTGAQTEYGGLVRAASTGTLFLDEITEMAVEVQAKLLRVLEEKAVRPVGAPGEIAVDVRFIASTNRDPQKAVAAGLLREDLYYRISAFRVDLPPLRERRGDIPLLVRHFAELLHKRGLRAIEQFDAAALRALQTYTWPGNVRELRNAIDFALTVGSGPALLRDDLPPHVLRGAAPPLPGDAPASGDSPSSAEASVPASDKDSAGAVPTMEEAERELIQRALSATGGNKLQAARMLGISRHRLYDSLRRFRIEDAEA